MKDDKLRHEIAEIIKNGVTYSAQTQSVVIHGAIEELLKLIHRQESAAYELATKEAWNEIAKSYDPNA